ncbi:hypothetical protein LUZ61_004743 [Rhynchospora tenuis]|uniref:DUF3741 domain-containing protein n=1 Tax=Rhynchospora tenuis TaxID=198213 RepID=A0AAD6ETZ3_9POAL|nr:hypothetical protein LUZ61_004743 [Rhynchospora tenuis]
MHQDIFKLAVHRSLSKNLNPREVNNGTSSVSLETVTLERSKEKVDKGREKQKEKRPKALAASDFTELQIHKSLGGDIRKNCATNLEVYSKNFAESLLRGAVDLQASIDMLESFQANVNRRKSRPGNGDGIEGFVEGLNAKRHIPNGASSSHNNTEALKKVIKESLYKQILMTASSDDDQNSSNQSIRDNSNHNKSMGIVAKLMGLKGAPKDMENLQSTRRDTKEKTLSSPRALFDLERMPRVKKENITQERINPNRKALLDIMETMHFKGLMRNNQGGKVAIATSVRKDHIAKSVRQEDGKMANNKGVEKWDMRTFEEVEIETSKIVEINNAKRKGVSSVERRPARGVNKNEKKGVNTTTSKTVQKSERKIASTSNGPSMSHLVKSMPQNSTLASKKNSVVPMRNESSNMLVDGKIKIERKGLKLKNQKNHGTKNIHARNLESSYKLKRPETVQSMEDNWIKLNVVHEASPDTSKLTTSHSSIEDTESIDFSERTKRDITLLLLSNNLFPTFAKGDLQLCLDTAMEQVARKTRKCNLLYPPYHVGTIGKRPYFSSENLVTETTNGIRKLNAYKNLKTMDDLKDGLYIKLERDLKCTDFGINSIWDFGWLDWICVEEASNVVSDFTDYILCFLIEEVSLDLYTYKL